MVSPSYQPEHLARPRKPGCDAAHRSPLSAEVSPILNRKACVRARLTLLYFVECRYTWGIRFQEFLFEWRIWRAGSAPNALLCRPPAAGAGNPPYSELPPHFDRLENVAMIVREFVPAVGLQKLRAQIPRQHHPMRPTCAHSLSGSRRSAAYALSHVSSRRVFPPVRRVWTVWE